MNPGSQKLPILQLLLPKPHQRPELQPERVFLTSRHTGTLDDSGRVRMELTLE